MDGKKFSVLEIFAGSARMTSACQKAGITVGPNIDLLTGYDLLLPRGQEDTWEVVLQGEPEVIFMAPPCTCWSSLSNVRPEADRLERRRLALPMVSFCADVASYQHERNKYFLIENPETSQMWNTESMTALSQMNGVRRTTIHMCAYGLVDPATGCAMKKPISLLHNIPMNVFHRLIRRCDNKHEHQRITGSSPG